jgi:hypothetical protein
MQQWRTELTTAFLYVIRTDEAHLDPALVKELKMLCMMVVERLYSRVREVCVHIRVGFVLVWVVC